MTVTDIASEMTRAAVETLSAAKSEPDWMRDLRLAAWERYESLPLPDRRDEEWRRTDISKLKLDALRPYAPASGTVGSPLQLSIDRGGLLSQVNGEITARELRTEVAEQGVIFTDLDAAVREHPDLVRKYFMTEAITTGYNKFAALNAALWSGGTFLYVPRNVDLGLPLQTLYALTASGSAMFTHTLLVLEAGARATYIEEYTSAGIDSQSLNAGVLEAFVADGAHLTLISLEEWRGAVYDLSAQRALIDRDATIDWLTVGLGDGLSKINIEAGLRGAGSSAQMLGVLWGYGKAHTHYHTVQDHIAPHTTSDLLYKGALTDASRSVFGGTIRVHAGAMGTDAYQANRNVLLSDKASAFPSPNLEIAANEVRCTHGASVGKVDQDQVFYLMSRGLPREEATRMVVEGFFADVLKREPVGSIRENLRDLIARKMDGA